MTLLRGFPILPDSVGQFANEVAVSSNPLSPSGTEGFPDPVAGVITLSADTCYKIIGDINIGNNRIVMPEYSCLDGRFGASLTNTLAGQPMITTQKSANILGLSIFPSGGASSFIEAVPASLVFGQNLFINDCTISGFDTLGNIGNYNLINIDLCTFVGNTNPFTIKNNIGVMYCNELLVILASGQQFVETDNGLAASEGIELHSSLIKNSAGSTFVNVQNPLSFPSEGFRIINDAFDDGSIAFTGILETDLAYIAKITIGLKDTSPTSLYSFAGNVTPTSIGVNGTWYKIDGTTVNPYTINKFINTTSNRTTYIGKNPRSLSITANIGGTGGSNATYEFTIAKNGTPITDFSTPVTTGAAGAAAATTIVAIVDVVTNDYIELFVRRTSSSGNFTANTGVIRVQEI